MARWLLNWPWDPPRVCGPVAHADKIPMPVASLFRKEPSQEQTRRRRGWNEVQHPMARLGVAGLGSCNGFRMMRISSGRCMARGPAPTLVSKIGCRDQDPWLKTSQIPRPLAPDALGMAQCRFHCAACLPKGSSISAHVDRATYQSLFPLLQR